MSDVIRDKVLSVIRESGPILHRDIAKMVDEKVWVVLETIYPLMRAGIVLRVPGSMPALWHMNHSLESSDEYQNPETAQVA